MKIATPCTGGCGKLVRPTSGRAEDYPNTVANRGSGYCRTCRPRASRAKGHQRPAFCTRCGHATRPWMAPESAHPGTRRASTEGVCDQCVKAEVVASKVREKTQPREWLASEVGYHEDFDVEDTRRSLHAWHEEQKARRASLRRYPVNGFVVQHNPINDVAVVLAAGVPVTAAHGLPAGLLAARRMDPPAGPSQAATMGEWVPGLSVR